MNNEVFGKTMKNMRKHSDIKFVTAKWRKTYLVSEPKYHATMFFTENPLAIEMKKMHILMNKAACLKLSILELSKTMYECWNGYRKFHYIHKNRLYL